MLSLISRQIGLRLPIDSLLREKSQWVLWFPVGMGLGIILYFSLETEPTWHTPWLLLVGSSIGLVICRSEPLCLTLQLALFSVALGFILIDWRVARVTAPRIQDPLYNARITAFVDSVELEPSGYRLILSDLAGDPWITDPPPAFVRVKRQTMTDPPRAGDRIAVNVNLWPPGAPVIPLGTYDFQRYAFFQRLGASGVALKDPSILETPETLGNSLFIARLRESLQARIIHSLNQSPEASVIITLMTGERGNLSADLKQTFIHSGLAHLLSISGLHVGLIGGAMFFFVRGGLAAVPFFALRYPIKKWAATMSIGIILFYMLIAGARIPTIRATIMIGLMMGAIMVDRRPLSIRLILVAAVVILVFIPESVLTPSFQMSFFIILALCSLSETLGKRVKRWQAEKGLLAKGISFALGIAIVSGVATLVSLLFTAFHFQMMTGVGVITNMVAVPLTSILIMPFILLTYLAFPFGAESLPLAIAALGVERLIAIASWGASLDFAIFFTYSMPIAVFGFFLFGLLWLCLWKSSWRWLGLGSALVGGIVFLYSPAPDIFIDGRNSLIALRTSDASLSLSRRTRASYTVRTWQQHNANHPFSSPWPERGTHDTLSCDPLGCVYQRNGHQIAFPRKPAALREDCQNASLVVALFLIKDCEVAVIDAFKLYAHGAHIVYLEPNRPIRIVSVKSRRGLRPWTTY